MDNWYEKSELAHEAALFRKAGLGNFLPEGVKTFYRQQKSFNKVMFRALIAVLQNNLSLLRKVVMTANGHYSWTANDAKDLMNHLFADNLKLVATAVALGYIPIPIPKVWAYYIMWRQGKGLSVPQTPDQKKHWFDRFVENYIFPSTYQHLKTDAIRQFPTPLPPQAAVDAPVDLQQQRKPQQLPAEAFERVDGLALS